MEIKGYKVLKEYDLKEINSKGYLIKHEKSGAYISIIKNDDTNKVFNIAFRTPVHDNTGVPHILEHSVLCGSRKYPVKDPFVELAKGSLNTFLNAMTYNDKTCYPVASYNDNDFKSLCDVYMDAVLNPNIYRHEEIFRQEGWTYELESEEDELTVNGVVYNEMKGAYSDPETIIQNEIERSMYPDTTYGFESGGEPGYIPELSYEDFLEFHKKYYHPSNSYIYFYGNIDIEERLAWLDNEYLSKYNKENIDSDIKEQPVFHKPVEKWIDYPISEEENEDNKAIFSYSTMLGSILNMEEYYGFQIIEYLLIDSQGAILKNRLMEAGIARDIHGGSNMYMKQPSFEIIANEADINKKDEFLKIINDTLTDIVNNGFDDKVLQAAIEVNEFRRRETDCGTYPKGLIYGLDMLDTWLYDKEQPFMIYEYDRIYKILRDGVNTGFYEKLVEKYLLNNNHTVKIYAKPVKGLSGLNEDNFKRKMAEIKAGMSREEIKNIVAKTKALKEYQKRKESEEDLKTIPILDVKDIDKEPEKFNNIEKYIGETKVIYNNISTNKIAYVDLYCNMDYIEDEDIPYYGLLSDVLVKMNTKDHDYRELETQIHLNTGGIDAYNLILNNDEAADVYNLYTVIRSRSLYGKLDKTSEILNEILTKSVFDDYGRLKDIIGQTKANLENSIINSAAKSATRASAHCTESDVICDKITGIDYYRFLSDIDKNFEEKKEAVAKKLFSIYKEMVTRGNIMVSLTCDDEGYDIFQRNCEHIFKDVPSGRKAVSVRNIKLIDKNEGFKTSSQVQYVAKAGNFKKEGYDFSGSMYVLCNLMNMDYLWNRIRVDGGAYGCGMTIAPFGKITIHSYRDPHIKNTLKIYDEIGEYLRNFDADERTLSKLIIGTISNLDTPLTARIKGMRNTHYYLKNTSYEKLKKIRYEVLNVTVDDIRSLAGLMDIICKENNMCTVGNEAKITEEKEVFDVVTSLL